MKILILGAGPTGLGAAWRLNQLGHAEWEVWEQDQVPGGLSRSITDEDGFTWDIGGHVLFSHYQTFDRLMDQTLGAEGWLSHERESWIRVSGAWVPYPFQYNIHRLPPEQTLRCFKGLIEAGRHQTGDAEYRNFEELNRALFGEGINALFMRPYNRKVWAYPPEDLATGWIGERVALPDLSRIAESVILGKDNISWGPNNQFRFPQCGGTGAIWQAVAGALPQEKVFYGREVVGIDPQNKVVTAQDGTETHYDALVTTLPLDRLVELAGLERLAEPASLLQYSSVHTIGVALNGQPGPELRNKCWMYFPEDNCPFYRVTVFSNYSPNNVPDASRYWSLMAEVSESTRKPVHTAQVVEETIQGMLNTGLIEDRRQVHHAWMLSVQRAYPTPGIRRDEALATLLPALEQHGIYSRGRFGAWRYEVSNQDHSFMQGVEVVHRLLLGTPELTLWFPDLVNTGHPVYGKAWM